MAAGSWAWLCRLKWSRCCPPAFLGLAGEAGGGADATLAAVCARGVSRCRCSCRMASALFRRRGVRGWQTFSWRGRGRGGAPADGEKQKRRPREEQFACVLAARNSVSWAQGIGMGGMQNMGETRWFHVHGGILEPPMKLNRTRRSPPQNRDWILDSDCEVTGLGTEWGVPRREFRFHFPSSHPTCVHFFAR